MRIKNILFTLCIAGVSTAYSTPKPNPQGANGSLSFVENKGQVTDQYGNSRQDINYRIGAGGLSLFVGSGQLHYQWARPVAQKTTDKQQLSLYRMDVTLVGANKQAKPVAEQKQNGYERYYTPQFGEQGATAYSYQKLTYKEVYPNIDWVLYVQNNTVEYDFVVRPGGKVSDIKLQYGGATNLSIDKSGRLIATTPMGSVTEAAPISFQQADGKAIASSFKLYDNTVSFATADYSGTLVIDPTLSWSTYYGGALDDYTSGGNLSVDTAGNIYIAGYTNSITNIATTGAHQATLSSGNDAFLAKFDKLGNRKWGTYYGGTLSDFATGIVCDKSGNIFLGGYSNSTSGIATSGSYQPNIAGSSDAFVAKFDSAGARVWATYYGGTSAEQSAGITTDGNGNIYLTGYTSSTAGIATTGAYQAARGGGQDAFIVKFTNTGTRIWSTYFGGSTTDNGISLSCDLNNNIYLSGFTRSASAIASTGAFQTALGGSDDGFIAKFDSSGVKQWSSYIGGTADERVLHITNDSSGYIYLCGYTFSSNMATTGSHQSTPGGSQDGFMAKFSNSGNRVWATYYGGSMIDALSQVVCDANDNLFVVGVTGSMAGIATVGGFKDTLTGAYDVLIAKFDTSGTRSWGSYFGGDADDIGSSIYANPLSEIYIAGTTPSLTGLSTAGSYQSSYGGGLSDVFLAKLNACALTAPTLISGVDTVCRFNAYVCTVPVVSGAISYTWTLPAGYTGSSTSNTITITAGTHSDTIKVAANFLCGTSATISKAVYVPPLPTITPAGTVQICAGDSATFTANTGTAYQWLQGGLPVSGATAASYTASAANTYAVIVTNANACADTSLNNTLIVHPLPVPVITASGSVLSTGTYATYQWSRNGTAITGATGQSYTLVVREGDYTVTVTDSNGCSATSAIYTPATGIHETGAGTYVRIYPVPATDWLYVDATEPVTLSLSSIEGKLLLNRTPSRTISLADLPAGLYILHIYDSNTGMLLFTEKLVKAASKG